jgi:hypothetical protein
VKDTWNKTCCTNDRMSHKLLIIGSIFKSELRLDAVSSPRHATHISLGLVGINVGDSVSGGFIERVS